MTARERVTAVWRHYAPTSGKYAAMCEAIERAMDAHAKAARAAAIEEAARSAEDMAFDAIAARIRALSPA